MITSCGSLAQIWSLVPLDLAGAGDVVKGGVKDGGELGDGGRTPMHVDGVEERQGFRLDEGGLARGPWIST